MATDYQCVMAGDNSWHLTQEQASPPPILRGGAYTSCAIWVEFKRGYDRRRPTCPACLKHVEVWEARHSIPAPAPVVEVPVEPEVDEGSDPFRELIHSLEARAATPRTK
jgi:hypothetical protein